MTSEITYDSNQSSPVTGFAATEHAVASDGAEEMATFKFSKLSFQPTPPSEFLLPAFGLPEVKSESSGHSSRLFAIVVSLIAIAILLYLAYRNRARLGTLKPRSGAP
jgi:hypothetical protein